MTDRHAGYVVALEENIREDDAEAIITALRQIRGVASVEPVSGDHTLAVAEQRVRTEYREKILKLLLELR